MNKPYPVQFAIGRRNMLPGIEYGVVGMAVGGIRSVRVSPQLTYYERKANPSLPENVALRYQIQLLRISDQWDNAVYAEVFLGSRRTPDVLLRPSQLGNERKS